VISVSEENDGKLFGDVIYSYTAQDAVEDGLFVPVGTVGHYPVYFTSNLFAEGYEDEAKRKTLVERGLEMLRRYDAEDTEYMRLRVIERDRIWLVLNGEGYTFMKPEDY
jgi:type I site-specific restriction endonuclease